MEGDDLSSFKPFQAKLGLQKASSLNLFATRVRNMEGEEKKTANRKRSKSIGITLDSDDDEPIGCFLKLKRARNPKKVKEDLGGDGKKGAKFVAEDADFGGMDDTLASLWKKLKGSKKDVGSASAGQLEDTSTVDKSCNNECNDALDVTMNAGVENKCKGRVKHSKAGIKKSRFVSGAVVDEDSSNLRSDIDKLSDHKGKFFFHGEGSGHSSDSRLEDSLSACCEKEQSGLTRKSHPNSSLNYVNRTRILEDGFTPTVEDISSVFMPTDEIMLRSASTANVVGKDLRAEDSSQQVGVSNQLDSASEQSRTGKIRTSGNGSCPASNYVEEGSDTCKGLPCIERTTEECNGFEDKRHGSLSEIIGQFPNPDSATLLTHHEGIQDDCVLTKEGFMMDSRSSDRIYGEICSVSGQRDNFQTEVPNNGENFFSMHNKIAVVRDISEMPYTSSGLIQIDDEVRNKVWGNASEEICKSWNEGTQVGYMKSVSSKSSPSYLNMDDVTKNENQLDFDQHPKESNHVELHPVDAALVSLEIQETCSNRDEDAILASVSSEKENAGAFDIEICAHADDSSISIKKCNSILQPNQPLGDAIRRTCPPSHISINNEAHRASSPTTLDENESCAEDAGSMPDCENKDGNLSAAQRAMRKAKKPRFGDMAYEGDADWDMLVNEQFFLEHDQVVDGDRSHRTREKSDSSSISITDAENGGAAAVSAGLRARAAGPLEKIKFKEVLKRKGGLQEYLECRNHILALWSKDVSRVLPLADCGVTDAPSKDEIPRASLTREIYTFLDQYGYINVGIASDKDKTESGFKQSYKLLEDKKFEGSPGTSVADLEDGVSFILGQVKSPGTYLEAKNGVATGNEGLASTGTEGRDVIMSLTHEFPNVKQPEAYPANDTRQNDSINPTSSIQVASLDVTDVFPLCPSLNSMTLHAIDSETKNQWQNTVSSLNDDIAGGDSIKGDSEDKKKIIVVGAGPAGLTAARHLQRQGFSVIVLEARDRIGGRVYTDRSSLSVPVDLGASIITGVEADVASERRPDPSSLICSQLGLELTILNSDCPLYDILTGEKVARDLDEALEAEFNSLLDDMLLLVEQKGQQAMKMSLEDGLEYALKSRRMARSGMLNASSDSRTCVDGRVLEQICFKEEIFTPLERRVMDWHFANLEYGCAALLKEVSLPYWNQDDVYGGFGGAHCMIKGGYSTVLESLGDGLSINLNHVVTDILYGIVDAGVGETPCNKVKVCTSDGSEFVGDAALITIPLGCLKAETIKFSPPLPQWKQSSIQRLGFGVLNKVVLEFPEVFWDDSVDYFGATAEETDHRGHCFMFWNVRKTVGAPVLIALVVGRAAIDGQSMSSSDHVSHALMVLRKIFGEASVPDPLASVVTDWGRDPFSYGAYSYVAIGSSGEDYDILGRPVENCLFFAGEATCKEHPDTVGGAVMSGLREAVRIVDILRTGIDYTAEVEAIEDAQRRSESERDEVMDITRRLEEVEISNELYKNSLDRARNSTREALLKHMFFNVKTGAGRLHLVKKLLNLPIETLKSFAGTRKGLSMLNSWILDSMGKDGTQLLRHCVRLLVLVSTDLLAVRLSGIGKTVKEKVCVHTSRDIRAIASQLVSVWLEVFRREKASNGGQKLMRLASTGDSKKKPLNNAVPGKPPLRSQHSSLEHKGSLQVPASSGDILSDANVKKLNGKLFRAGTGKDSKLESRSHASLGRLDAEVEDNNHVLSAEEQAALAAAEAACAAARAAAEAYASSEARSNLQNLPKIPSFHKFARREQYAQMDEYDLRRKWSGGVLGRQDCISEIDSRNCRVRDWPVDFSAACANLDSSRMSVDNLSQRSHSNEIASHMNLREQSGESAAVDSSLFTKAWVDTAGSVGIKDYHAIERWQSQAAAADSEFFHPAVRINDEEDSNAGSKRPTWKNDGRANGSSVSQVTINKEPLKNHPQGADHIKQAVVDFVASLLMPVYKTRKIDREGYKSIMKKCATKVMELATDAEKAMAVTEFLDFKRKNKIRAFVDKLIERHMAMKVAGNH